MMQIVIGVIPKILDEYPEIDFFYYRNDEDEIIYQREGEVIFTLDEPKTMYYLPDHITQIEIGDYVLLRCHLIKIDPVFGAQYRFEDYYRKSKQER